MNATQFWQFGKKDFPATFQVEIDVSQTPNPNGEVIGFKNNLFFGVDFSESNRAHSIHNIVKKLDTNKFLISIDMNRVHINMSYKDFYNYYKTNWINVHLLFDTNFFTADYYIKNADLYLGDELLYKNSSAIYSKATKEVGIAQAWQTFRQLTLSEVIDKVFKIKLTN